MRVTSHKGKTVECSGENDSNVWKGDIITKQEEESKEERKITGRIMGPGLTEEGYKLLTRKATKKLSIIEVDMRKKPLTFYGHSNSLPQNRLAKRILK